jgi:hypothetical protein
MGNVENSISSIMEKFKNNNKIILCTKDRKYLYYDNNGNPCISEIFGENCIFVVKRLNNNFIQMIDLKQRKICIGDTFDTTIILEEHDNLNEGVSLKGANSGKYLGVSKNNVLVYSDSLSWDTRYLFLILKVVSNFK